MSDKNPYNHFDQSIRGQYERHNIMPPLDMWREISAQFDDLDAPLLDTQFQEKFSNHALKPPTHLWKDIEASTATIEYKEEKKKKRLGIYWWLIGMGVLAGVLFYYNKKDKKVEVPRIAIEMAKTSSEKEIKQTFNISALESLVKKKTATTQNAAVYLEKELNEIVSEKASKVFEKKNVVTSVGGTPSKISIPKTDGRVENEMSLLHFPKNGESREDENTKLELKKASNSIEKIAVNTSRIKIKEEQIKKNLDLNSFYKTNFIKAIKPLFLVDSSALNDSIVYALTPEFKTDLKNKKSKFSIAAIVSPSYANQILLTPSKETSGYQNDPNGSSLVVFSKGAEKYRKYSSSSLWNVGIDAGFDINENMAISVGLHYNYYRETTKILNETKYNLPLILTTANGLTLLAESVYGIAVTSLDSASFRLFVPPPPPPPPPPPNPHNLNSVIPYNFDYKEQFSMHSLYLPITFRYKVGNKKIKPVVDLGIEAIYNFLSSTIITITPLGYPTATPIVVENFHDVKTFNLSASIGLGVEYEINSHWSMMLVPTFNYTLLAINNQGKVNLHPFALRFSTGIRYNF